MILLISGCGIEKPVELAISKEPLDRQDDRVEIVLATMRHPEDTQGIDNEIQNAAACFNRYSNRYHVKVVDYMQEGATDKESALRRLNTEIAAGNYPDMICFSQISPFPFLSKGLLLDMEECIAEDELINADDIIAKKALCSFGGLYFLGSNVTVDTMIADYSRFGDNYGWSLAEYLKIEAQADPGTWMIYNITPEIFLDRVSRRYTCTAINWNSGTCNFNNQDFVDILKASERIAKPEAGNDELYGFTGTLISEGKIIAGVSISDQVYSFAINEQDAGGKLSYIGWPTIDGSCGTDIRFQHPVGIVTKSDHIEGCWEFIKYLLKDEDVSYGIPVYKPRLLERIEDAKKKEDPFEQMSPDQAARFLDLLDNIDHLAIYDETVMGIVMEESADFFAGYRSAEETASIIQSKVNLYLSEMQ